MMGVKVRKGVGLDVCVFLSTPVLPLKMNPDAVLATCIPHNSFAEMYLRLR